MLSASLRSCPPLGEYSCAIAFLCSDRHPLRDSSIPRHFATAILRAQACRHAALSLAAKSKIESSTIESSRGDGAKAVQKRRLQIWITRGPKFEEHRAEVRAPWQRLRFPLLRASL